VVDVADGSHWKVWQATWEAAYDEKYEMLLRARFAWASQVNHLGIDIPGYEITSFANTQDTNFPGGASTLA
jgi:hypothetical protein